MLAGWRREIEGSESSALSRAAPRWVPVCQSAHQIQFLPYAPQEILREWLLCNNNASTSRGSDFSGDFCNYDIED